MTSPRCIVALCINGADLDAEYGDWHLSTPLQVAIAIRENEISHTMLSVITAFVELSADGSARNVTSEVAAEVLAELSENYSQEPRIRIIRAWAGAHHNRAEAA